jgi:hypothetical protein
LISGLVNTTAEVGGALGLAVVAAVAASRTNDVFATGNSMAAALLSGYRLAFVICTICLVGGAVIALTALHSAKTISLQPRPGDREAA